MTPIWMIERARKLDPISERNLAERRFSALAAAVREHESKVRGELPSMRACDTTLYRRLRQINGDLVARERTA